MAPDGSPSGFTPKASGNVQSVLVVDDSPAIQRTIADALVRLGVADDQVTILDSGDDALEVFTPLSPDLVLIDTTIPGIDTYDMVQAMLLEEPDTRVVPLTEKPKDHPDVSELLSFGVFDVLRKPIRVEDIGQLLRRIDAEQPGTDRIA